jgi:hypothetical protein
LKSICIPASVEILGDHSFANGHSLEIVTFESGCEVRRIESHAFLQCWALKSICIPASLEMVGEFAFQHCNSLENISFESGSKLSRIEQSTFEFCGSLKSFCVPARVEIICDNCFRKCTSLARLTVEPDSKLRRIDPGSFDGCSFLESILTMPLVKRMQDISEPDSRALSKMRFDFPSNILRLAFTPAESLASIQIPDSVERVRCSIAFSSTRYFALNFGTKSNLREIRFKPHPHHHDPRYTNDRKPRVFVRVGESTLKGFRSTLEVYDARMPNTPEFRAGMCMLVPGSHELDVEEESTKYAKGY